MSKIVAVSLLVIAVMQIVRVIQNEVQLSLLKRDAKQRKDSINRMIDDMRTDNREWVKDMLKEFEEQECDS